MRIKFNTDAVQPMVDWLMNYKTSGTRDETELRKILSLPDYQIEFERYSMDGLPVCGISYEEAVDFFMSFDQKEFENPRLQYKKAAFLSFFNNIEENLKQLELLTSITENNQAVIEDLLKNGLPDKLMNELDDINIILILSIGNSMGWPYKNYVDYDIAGLSAFTTLDDFLHVTAHEIHHILFGEMMGCEGICGADFFLQNFAYEGLAVHFNNNLATLMKPSKYADREYAMQRQDMEFYEAHFDEIFAMIKADYNAAKSMSLEEVMKLVSEHYEVFEFMGHPVKQYPTYYFGCYMWGLVDFTFGKERMFEAIADPPLFVKLYNQAAKEDYQLK